MPKTTLIHKIPLTLKINNGSVDILCEVTGINADPTAKQLLLLHPPGSTTSNHLYCYTIAAPQEDSKYKYYLAVYSGESPSALTIWPQPGGLATSPTFDLGKGESACFISVSVLAEPRVAMGGSDVAVLAPPCSFAGRRHVKSDFQGGEDTV